MACRPIGARWLTKPVMNYCLLYHLEQISVNLKMQNISLMKCIWTCLGNGGHCVQEIVKAFVDSDFRFLILTLKQGYHEYHHFRSVIQIWCISLKYDFVRWHKLHLSPICQQGSKNCNNMMTSSNGNIFCGIGPVSSVDSPRLFTQTFVQVQIKENIKAPRHWPFLGEFTGDRGIPSLDLANDGISRVIFT